MISVVIPTLWKIDRLNVTLTELNACKHVGEIILIDNTKNTTPIKLNKLNHILEGKNTYVNPAWNKGVKLAKFNKLLILNDDTWFDWSLIEKIEKYIKEDAGMIGIGKDNYQLKETTKIKLEPIAKRMVAFACAFFISKDNWVPIPEYMRIWGGDDWLFNKLKRAGKQNYKLINFKVDGYISATVDLLRKDEAFRLMMKDDVKLLHGKKI